MERIATLFEKPEQTIPRAILCGVRFSDSRFESSDESSLHELKQLLESAGGERVATTTQAKAAPEAATFIGSGKVEELRDMAQSLACDLILFDNDLSPVQIRNLEEQTGVQVMDRSMLILDLFAQRASTRAGKLQVELAQLQYAAPRLTSNPGALSRLGGGIGTRGPGESKLETDRRHIRERIAAIRTELLEVEQNRVTQRRARSRSPISIVSVVGYTNAGKSTLFNRLTGAGVLAEDRLFATLDPVMRKFTTPNGVEFLLCDTVGFVRKLPHHLVAAFRSTLEEMAYGDLILHLIDAAHPDWRQCEQVALQLIDELNAGDKPILTVYNKCDIADLSVVPSGPDKVRISARTGAGIDEMVDRLEQMLLALHTPAQLLIPYDKGGMLDQLYAAAQIQRIDYTENGIRVQALLDAAARGRFASFLEGTAP